MPHTTLGSLDKHIIVKKAMITNIQSLARLRNAADIIRGVYKQRVIITNIVAPNFLISKGLSLKIYGFSESFIISENEALKRYISEDFLSLKSDMARFGSMIYKIMSGNRFEFHIYLEIERGLDDSESKAYK